jgi:hypothetical protein
MSLKVTELKRGDRVVLNCPKGRIPKRKADFLGIFRSLEEAINATPGLILAVDATVADFLEKGERGWAGFLLGVSPCGTELRGAFIVEPDGSMREQEGRSVFIEQRLGRVSHG